MNELLAQGLQLMGVGMGVVFLFLGLLVGIVTLVSVIIQKGESVEVNAGAESINRDDLLVVLSEAVSRYRADHSK
ncbi:MAG TPA: OadG family transporter subunit [Mariprofundaceae bacterium]|nr:OadG family transporter subunit [Mariprofundaceae bacterium]